MSNQDICLKSICAILAISLDRSVNLLYNRFRRAIEPQANLTTWSLIYS